MSTEIGKSIPELRIFSKIGEIREISSFTVIGSAPGLVLSPPISIIEAPKFIILINSSKALSNSLYLPPSEKLSGVTFKIPIICGLEKERLNKFCLLIVRLWRVFFGKSSAFIILHLPFRCITSTSSKKAHPPASLWDPTEPLDEFLIIGR